MLTAVQSHFHAIIPRGRLRRRDPGRAHDISTTTAPRFSVGRRSAGAAARRRLLTGHRRPFASSSGGTPQPAAGSSSGPSSEENGSMSSSPLLGAEAANKPRPSSWWWVERVVDTAEARAQLGFAVPMVLTSMAYYGIPLVSVMFSGHLGDVHLAGATLGNSWATVTGYALVCIFWSLEGN